MFYFFVVFHKGFFKQVNTN